MTHYVLARDKKQFEQWVKEKGLKLQDCKFLDSLEKMQEVADKVDFQLKGVELIATTDWVGEDRKKEEIQMGARLISKWCRDRRLVQMRYDYVV